MTTDLIASFPAAGDGGTTLEQVEGLTARRAMAYVALSNPASVDALESGRWRAESIDRLRHSVDRASAGHVVLVGHCMGGLSAVRLSDGLGSELALPVSVLVINTPCPDSSGRIPTMSRFSDAEIAEVLAHDGFPRELLEDEDLLEEIAAGLREEAVVADRLAERIGSSGDLDALHVLSTRGDAFIPPEQCAGWRHRVSRSFHLTVVEGGHTLDETVVGALDRAIGSILASVQAESV